MVQIDSLDLGVQGEKSYEPYIIGTEARDKFDELLNYMLHVRKGLNFVGDPGTGKTHFGIELVKEFARQRGVGAYFFPCDENTTKANMVMGKTIENGSVVTVLAVIGHAAQYGGAVYVDELTHAMISSQSDMNTLLDQNIRTSIGDMLITGHKNFRLISGENYTRSAGNVGLKPSYASRCRHIQFEYPELVDEARIAKSILIGDVGAIEAGKIPPEMFRYLTGYARNVREITEGHVPVSARNVAAMAASFLYATRDQSAQMLPDFTDAGGTAAAPLRKKVASWIFGGTQSRADLVNKHVDSVLLFISQYGKEKFQRIVLENSMYGVDIEGVMPSKLRDWNAQMANSITIG